MTRLSHRDYDSLLSTIFELHERSASGALLPAASEVLSKLIRCDYFVIVNAKLEDAPPKLQLIDRWETDPRLTEDQGRRMAHYFPTHPFTRAAQETGAPVALKLSDFYSMRQLRDQPFYCDFYRLGGVGRSAAIGWPTPQGMFFLSANRGANERDFSARDLRLMELIRPHFEQARQEAERRTSPAALGSQQLRDLRLTPREREVARWMAQGKTNPEIARILGMNPRTAEKHVERILLKLGVENRTAAALLMWGANFTS
jgi:DNA-binding CsgD family transcriptional regulator